MSFFKLLCGIQGIEMRSSTFFLLIAPTGRTLYYVLVVSVSISCIFYDSAYTYDRRVDIFQNKDKPNKKCITGRQGRDRAKKKKSNSSGYTNRYGGRYYLEKLTCYFIRFLIPLNLIW